MRAAAGKLIMSTIARSSLFTSTLTISFAVASLCALASLGSAGCASDSDDTGVANDEMNAKPAVVAGAAEGETCSNGVFGTPVIECARGLACDFGKGTAPSGPSGSSSASTGVCAKPKGAAEGETCSNGVFGTPVIDCASGLVCDFGKGTAPSGPAGSSSASTGVCAKPKASDFLSCDLRIAFVCPPGSFDGCAVPGLTKGHLCIADSSRNEATSCALEIARVCEDGFVDACTITPAPSDKHVCTNL
jgi:hypothetical protein